MVARPPRLRRADWAHRGVDIELDGEGPRGLFSCQPFLILSRTIFVHVLLSVLLRTSSYLLLPSPTFSRLVHTFSPTFSRLSLPSLHSPTFSRHSRTFENIQNHSKTFKNVSNNEKVRKRVDKQSVKRMVTLEKVGRASRESWRERRRCTLWQWV